MRFQWHHLAAGATAILVLMLVWFSPFIFPITGANALVLRGGILLLGVVTIFGLLLWARTKVPATSAKEESSAEDHMRPYGGGSKDVDILVRDAAIKVAAARLAAGAKLSSL